MTPTEHSSDVVRLIVKGPRYYPTHFRGRRIMWRGEGLRNLALARKEAREYHATLPKGTQLDDSPPQYGAYREGRHSRDGCKVRKRPVWR